MHQNSLEYPWQPVPLKGPSNQMSSQDSIELREREREYYEKN